MHLCSGVLTRGSLRCRPLRAARPRILDPRHRCGGLGRGGLHRSFLVSMRFAVWLAIAATMVAGAMLAGAMVASAMLAVAVAIVPLLPAVAAIACAGGGGILGCCRRLAHPRNALANQLFNRGHRLAVGPRDDGDRDAAAAGAAGATDPVDIVVSMVRHVEIQNMAYIWNVEAAGCNIGSHEQCNLPATKLI